MKNKKEFHPTDIPGLIAWWDFTEEPIVWRGKMYVLDKSRRSRRGFYRLRKLWRNIFR